MLAYPSTIGVEHGAACLPSVPIFSLQLNRSSKFTSKGKSLIAVLLHPCLQLCKGSLDWVVAWRARWKELQADTKLIVGRHEFSTLANRSTAHDQSRIWGRIYSIVWLAVWHDIVSQKLNKQIFCNRALSYPIGNTPTTAGICREDRSSL